MAANPNAFGLADDAANFGYGNGAANNFALQQRAREKRLASTLSGSDGRSIGGPGVDPAWDAFFQAIDDKADRAGDYGLGFKTSFSPGLSSVGGAAAAPRKVGGLDMPTGPVMYGSPEFLFQQAAINKLNPSDNIDHASREAGLRILQDQADVADQRASDAAFARDPYRNQQDTDLAIARQGSLNDFNRAQAIKDETNKAAVYQAGEPLRNVQDFEHDREQRENFPYTKEYAGMEEARFNADAKQREAQTNAARVRSQGLRTLGELARQESTLPRMVAGATPKDPMIPNPALDALHSAIEDARSTVFPDGQGAPQEGGKVMSEQDLADFVASTPGMSPERARALAAQHGWTIR